MPLRHSRVVVNSFVFYILCLRENELFFFLDVVVFQFSESYELKSETTERGEKRRSFVI